MRLVLVPSLIAALARLTMLAWALWLATALLRWVRQGWEALGTGGCGAPGRQTS